MNKPKFSANLAIDSELKVNVLEPLATHFVSQESAIFFCAAWAYARELDPLSSRKSSPNWHADSGEAIYNFFQAKVPEADPVKLVGDYANAALKAIESSVAEGLSFSQIFEIATTPEPTVQDQVSR
jgi:hypothetical protein